MPDSELNASQRQISSTPSTYEVIRITYFKDGTADSSVSGGAKTSPRCTLTSKTRPTGPRLFCESYTKPGDGSVLDSAISPQTYGKIPEATEKNKTSPTLGRYYLSTRDHRIPLFFQVLHV